MKLSVVAATMRRALGSRRDTRVQGHSIRDLSSLRGRVDHRSGLLKTGADELAFVPPSFRAADPSFVGEMTAGAIGLDAGVLRFGPDGVFAAIPHNETMARDLYGFSWLRHLDAARSDAGETVTQEVLLEWIASQARRSPVAREPQVAARRALSLLAHAEAGLTGASPQDFDRILDFIAAEMASLTRDLPRWPLTLARLTGAIAIAEFELCRGVPDAAVLRAAEVRLATELDRQILADGGHFSRNPVATLDVVLDLLPLKRLYGSCQLPVPQAVTAALARLKTMLMFLRHRDNQLARFNGMGPAAVAELSTAMKQLQPLGAPVVALPYEALESGYVRLVAGQSTLLFDAGPTDQTLPGEAPFAGALSFEFSAGRSALVVNCGADGHRISAQRPETRATASHSALVLADASSAPMSGGRSGSTSVDVSVPGTVDTGGTIMAVGTAYRERFGYKHHRTLTLSAEGRLVEGCDALETVLPAPSSYPFAIHFHLHPSVYVETDGTALRLTAGDGSRWRFTAEGAVPAIETSTYFAATTGAKPTIQIVLRGRVPMTPMIRWRLEQSSAPTLQIK